MKTYIRIAVSTFFFTQGLGFASWASRIPDIKNTLHLSDAGLGTVLFALPLGSLTSLSFSGWLVTHFGSKKTVLAGASLYIIVLVFIGFAAKPWILAFFLFMFGITGNLVNIGINTQAIGVENIYKKSIMASFHGAWSVAGFAGAALGSFIVSRNIAPAFHFIGIAAICLPLIVMANRFTLRGKMSTTGGSTPLFAKPDRPLLMLGVIGFCGMASEGTMFDWSGVYFQKVLQTDPALTTLGYVSYMSAMAGGRFVGDWMANKIGRRRMLELSGLLISTGLLISVIFPTIVPVTIGFVLVGFGVSSVVPLVYSAAGKSATLSPGMALAAVSTISYFGFLIGPPLIGYIAEASSLRYSFAVIAVLGFCTMILSSRSTLIR